MFRQGLAVASNEGFRIAAVATAFGFGLRHGVDWDHIAAITDITGSQVDRRRSLVLSTLYALGHALVVLLLGVVAILFGDLIPPAIDSFMGRVVGITLLALGCYVFFALARDGRNFRMRSRWMLVFSGVRRLLGRSGTQGSSPAIEIEHEHDHPVDQHSHPEGDGGIHAGVPGAVLTRTRLHRHRHVHRGSMPLDPFTGYGRGTALFVGMVHGVGAETPSQVLIFLAAVGAGGTAVGILLLITFLVGLFVSNTVVAVVSAFGFLHAERHFVIYVVIAVVTGVFSTILGLLLLFGRGNVLSAIVGG